MKSSVLIPAAAGAVTGAVLAVVSGFFPSLSICIAAVFIIVLLMSLMSSLTSGPAFGGWIKASPTAINGMNAEIRSRRNANGPERLGAVIYLGLGLLTYVLLNLLLSR